nr:DUF2510 domain-containing protein [Cryobacterium sp. BB736]
MWGTLAVSDNSYFSAPAGWYPDPLGLPQLRWWDSTSWTHQTAEARQPMVMQETTFAWADDDIEEEPSAATRRERRERERKGPIDNAPPTAQMLLQLEPPSREDIQVDMPEPEGVAQPTRDDEPFVATFTESTSTESSDDAYRIFDNLRDNSQEQFAQQPFGQNQYGAQNFQGAPQGYQQPFQQEQGNWAQYGQQEKADFFVHGQAPDASGWAPQHQQQFAQQQRHAVTHTTPVWMIALIPMLQLVLSLLLLTAFGMGDNTAVMAAIWFAPYPFVVLFAFLDRRTLKKAGHQQTAHWAWALLTAPIYLIVRAVASIRESGNGFGPVLVWFALALLQVGSVVAVPGLIISSLPAVFAAEAEASIMSDAQVIGSTMTVTCPAAPPVLIGQQFECSGVQANGTELSILVSLERVNGWIDWRVDDWGIYTIG